MVDVTSPLHSLTFQSKLLEGPITPVTRSNLFDLQQQADSFRVYTHRGETSMKRILAAAGVAVLLFSAGLAQSSKPASDAPNTDMSSPDMGDMHDMPGMTNEGSAHAMHSMEGHHLDMGPHMKMTSLRTAQPGDQEKADQIVLAARKCANKYQDYKVALADGYKIFLPDLPQKQYHFTNYFYGFEAARHFNPEHPTSLLYEKHGDSYKLIGVMYTAPKRSSEDDLNARIPMSIAQWHAHVNMCIAPDDKKSEMWGAHAKFGLQGSIATQEECDAAGGRFMPQIFGWMVHVYPSEQKAEDIWSVERQHGGGL